MALLKKTHWVLGEVDAPQWLKEIPNVAEAVRQGCENEYAERMALPCPTNAPPGSPRKVEILAKRMASGQQLHHPKDFQDYENTSELPTSNSGARK